MVATATQIPQVSKLPSVHIADGTTEALKWFALALMLGDHINKYLFDHHLPYIYESARLVMPLFGFILAYNLARPGSFEAGAYTRTLRRLAFFAALASPFFLALNGPWPLNVMWMLFLVVAILYCIRRGTQAFRALAIFLFVVCGAFVEFWWFGMLFCIAAWFYCRRPSWTSFVIAAASLASLTIVNRNWWALAVVPAILIAPHLNLRLPRLRWAFYAFYPAHLVVLLVLSHV